MKLLKVVLGSLGLWLSITLSAQDAPAELSRFNRLLRIESFHSELVVARTIDLYLPPVAYDSLQLLIAHDGQMLFDATRTWNGQEWGFDESLDSLHKQGKIAPTLLVGIWNIDTLRHREYFPQKAYQLLPSPYRDSLESALKRPSKESSLFAGGPQSDAYLHFITTELLPYLHQHFPIKKEAQFIMGSSMGGLISMYATLEYPQVFKGAACLSTHWIGKWDDENNPIPQAFLDYMNSRLQSISERPRFYFDCGDETLDRFYPPHQLAVDHLFWPYYKGVRSEYKSLRFPGADHSENAWRERLAPILEYLLRP